MNSVWIAGAGYLGLPLARLLQAQVWQVTASSRTFKDGCNWHAWDFEHSAFPLQTFQAAQTWVILLPPSSSADYVEHMHGMCQLAIQAGVAHVVYTSSTSVYGGQVRDCDEHSALLPETASAQKLVACERIWLDSGLPKVSVLRLGGLYDDARHPVAHLSGRVGLAGAQQPVNVLHRDHALQALCDVVALPKQALLNVVEKNHPSRAEFYTQEARRLGLPVPVFNSEDEQSGKIVRSCYQHWSF